MPPLSYNSLLTKNISIMVYSGDVDAIVPFTGTRAWLDKLALPIAAPFRPWFLGKQTGGYVTKCNSPPPPSPQPLQPVI